MMSPPLWISFPIAARASLRTTEAIAVGENARDNGSSRSAGKKDVDEASARNFGAFNPGRRFERGDQPDGEFAWILSKDLGELQRDAGSVVPVLRLFRPL